MKYALTGFSRIFLLPGRARPDHVPSYQSCLKAGGVSQGFGDVTKIECPDPNQYGKFIQVGEIRGAEERATTTLTGRYAADVKSELLELARKKCAVDLQIHFGACTDPSQFNVFTKALVLENAFLTNFGTGDLGALASDEQASVDQTADLSAVSVYEVLPLAVAQVGAALTSLEVVDVVISGTPSCGECLEESDGCDKIFAVMKANTSSPGVPPTLLYSLDGGSNWSTSYIDTLDNTDVPTGVAIVGNYVVVISSTAPFVAYALISELGNAAPWVSPSDVAAYGLNANHAPTDISSVGTFAYISAAGHAASSTGGFIYGMSDPTAGVTILEPGALAGSGKDLNKISAYSESVAVAAGDTGVVLYTTNGGATWAAATIPTSDDLSAVFCKSAKEFFVGAKSLYYTVDGGVTWGTKANFSGAGTTGAVLTDISFATDSIGYIAHNLTPSTNTGRVFRTYDGGNSWVKLPDGAGTFPTNRAINAIAPCKFDPNFLVCVGLKDTTTGIMVVGQA